MGQSFYFQSETEHVHLLPMDSKWRYGSIYIGLRFGFLPSILVSVLVWVPLTFHLLSPTVCSWVPNGMGKKKKI